MIHRRAPGRCSEEISHALRRRTPAGILVIEQTGRALLGAEGTRPQRCAASPWQRVARRLDPVSSAHTEFLLVMEGSRRARSVQHSRGSRRRDWIRGIMVDISHRAQPTAATEDGLLAAQDERELAGRALAAASSSREHAVRFYEDDVHLAEAVTAFLADGLRAGDLVAVI